MLRDITIGQFYPGDSLIHRFDPRVKILGALVYLISLFLFRNLVGYLVVVAFLGAVIFLSRVPLTYAMKGLQSIVALLLFTTIFHFFFTKGNVLLAAGPVQISEEGVKKGVFLGLRLLLLVIGSSYLTYTTTAKRLTDGLENLMSPLKKIRVPVHDIATMMALTLRFIPVLLEETNRLIKAQQARGADLNEGTLWQKAKIMTSMVVPLLVSATGRSFELAVAMESRCYQGDRGRTQMKPLRYQTQDRIGLVVIAFYVILVWLAGRIPAGEGGGILALLFSPCI